VSEKAETQIWNSPLSVGERVDFNKTIAESDVYLFAGITGDLARNHVDEEYMKKSPYGKRIVHGALLVGFMSTTSSLIIQNAVASGIDETPVSVGYDRIRFIKPVFIGDTITVRYEIIEIQPEKRRSLAKIDMTNQNKELVCAAQHILQWVKAEPRN